MTVVAASMESAAICVFGPAVVSFHGPDHHSPKSQDESRLLNVFERNWVLMLPRASAKGKVRRERLKRGRTSCTG